MIIGNGQLEQSTRYSHCPSLCRFLTAASCFLTAANGNCVLQSLGER